MPALISYVKSNAIRISAQSYYFRNKRYKLKCVLYVYLTKINTPYYGKKKGYRERENRNLHLKSNSATQLPYLQKLLTFQASFFSYDWYENNEKVYVKHLLYTSLFILKTEMKCDLLPIPFFIEVYYMWAFYVLKFFLKKLYDSLVQQQEPRNLARYLECGLVSVLVNH